MQCNIKTLCCSLQRHQLNFGLLLILVVAPLLHDLYFHHQFVIEDYSRLQRIEDELQAVVDVGAFENILRGGRLQRTIFLEMLLRAFEVKACSHLDRLVGDSGTVRFLFFNDLLRFLHVFGVDSVDVPPMAHSDRLEGLRTTGDDEACGAITNGWG